MKKMQSLCWSTVFAAGTIFFLSCSKEPLSLNRSPSSPSLPTCDTCAGPTRASDKIVIIYPQESDWTDRGNGRFECDLEPLLAGQAGPLDSIYIIAMYVVTGATAKQIIRGFSIDYNGASLAWYGFKLDFQMPDGKPPQSSLTLRLELDLHR